MPAGGARGAAGDIIVDLVISADEYLRYYEGTASVVLVQARDGRTIQFPASMLRRFVDHEGVRGTFLLRCDANNKLISMERVPARDTRGG